MSNSPFTRPPLSGTIFVLQTGVFRSDLPEKFRLVPSALQALIDNIDRDLTFAIEVESGVQRDTISNYDEVRFPVTPVAWASNR